MDDGTVLTVAVSQVLNVQPTGWVRPVVPLVPEQEVNPYNPNNNHHNPNNSALPNTAIPAHSPQPIHPNPGTGGGDGFGDNSDKFGGFGANGGNNAHNSGSGADPGKRMFVDVCIIERLEGGLE